MGGRSRCVDREGGWGSPWPWAWWHGEVAAEPFGVGGQVLLVNGQPVQVYVFASTADREKVVFSDDGTSVTVDGRPALVTWIAPPRIVVRDRRSARGQLLVTRATRIYRLDGTALKRATIADLRIGQVVRVWHFGPVAESYPYQARADVVVIASKPQG